MGVGREEGREVKACGECVNISSANSEKIDIFNVSNSFFFFKARNSGQICAFRDLLG